jgi:hypothetical protein
VVDVFGFAVAYFTAENREETTNAGYIQSDILGPPSHARNQLWQA